jgi:hypothetical protein
MYSKTCPIPVKNVRDKLIEMTPLSTVMLESYNQNVVMQDFSLHVLEENKHYEYHFEIIY